jgi:hypothetical protein
MTKRDRATSGSDAAISRNRALYALGVLLLEIGLGARIVASRH